VTYASAADLDHEPSACARTSSSRAFLLRPKPRVLWPVADAMRGRKVAPHAATHAEVTTLHSCQCHTMGAEREAAEGNRNQQRQLSATRHERKKHALPLWPRGNDSETSPLGL
jgi:hypothetical protein